MYRYSKSPVKEDPRVENVRGKESAHLHNNIY
jgi:hypothetical protein